MLWFFKFLNVIPNYFSNPLWCLKNYSEKKINEDKIKEQMLFTERFIFQNFFSLLILKGWIFFCKPLSRNIWKFEVSHYLDKMKNSLYLPVSLSYSNNTARLSSTPRKKIVLTQPNFFTWYRQNSILYVNLRMSDR